jgi:small conductance mechanosensitive channel
MPHPDWANFVRTAATSPTQGEEFHRLLCFDRVWAPAAGVTDRGANVIRQSTDDSGTGESGSSVLSDVGTEIEVTLDRWSVGQLGISDLIAAAAVILLGFVVARVLRWLMLRGARKLNDQSVAAVGALARIVGFGVYLVASAIALEILGFSLGPIFVLILIAVVVLLALRPLITNLSSGLVLQLRGALQEGDLVLTTGEMVGVVHEITTRTTVIDTSNGRRVHVPNSQLLNDVIVNYTSLGRRRSSFEVMVRYDEDLQLTLSTMRLALTQVDAIQTDPRPEVQVVRMLGQLVVIRALVWHPPSLAAERAALDGGIRRVIADLRTAGIALDGPTAVDLYADVAASSRDDEDRVR